MLDKRDITKAANSIEKLIDCGHTFHLKDEQQKLQYLIHYVEKGVSLQLHSKAEQLFNSLYRLQIDEKRLQFAIKNSTSKDLPRKLAELIVEKELQSIQWQKRFHS